MIYIADYLCQKHKSGYLVCGDTCLCERTSTSTVYILCDGIGSGVYANIASITCSQRIKELLRRGVPLRKASEMVASSMHRARKEKIPFSAFSAVVILPDGNFTVYTYENPNPIFIQNGTAKVMTPRYYTSGYEVIGECTGSFQKGDSLLLSSDGVTQAGLGRGQGFGIGSDGVVDFINRNHKINDDVSELPDKIVEFCRSFSNGISDDDTTLALLNCQEARELTLLTGPPSKHSLDHEYAMAIKKARGMTVVSGATTAEIVSRELDIPVETLDYNASYGTPPEYYMEGIDLSTEGAITLNQALNVLDEPIELMEGNSPVKRLCAMLKEADVIHFHVGNANNEAHEDMFFKQVGVRVRKTTVEMLADKLNAMGKIVTKRYY